MIAQDQSITQPAVPSSALEREALHRLPDLLAELLGEPIGKPEVQRPHAGIDLALDDSSRRRWLFEVKASSRPGLIEKATETLRAAVSRLADLDVEIIPVIVVPYMSPGGADTAAAADVNWIDLSGNASLRAEGLRVLVRGRPNAFPQVGRPPSPFAPRSARIARTLLLDPARWWRQKDLSQETGLDDGTVSRAVRRLADELLVERRDHELRPRDPGLLLDAWRDDYRFTRHDIVVGHVSGNGMELAHTLADRLAEHAVHHAFTGLPAAWAIDGFASFRLCTVYVEGDPRQAADAVGLRREERGANVQLVGPNDPGVFAGEQRQDELTCVSTAQVYLDLLHLPERAAGAAEHLREKRLWTHGRA